MLPFWIKCLLTLALLMYITARLIIIMYKDEIALFAMFKKSDCKPGIAAGLLVIGSMICVIVVIFWAIFALL